MKLDQMIERDGPVLVLDYTYFGLLADKGAPVGGIIYGRSANLRGIEFYAPLDQWSEKLGAHCFLRRRRECTDLPHV